MHGGRRLSRCAGTRRRSGPILLDTNALIWLHQGHPRATRLTASATRLYASPAGLLELQFLVEAGRLRVRGDEPVASLMHDDRWAVDNPSSSAWFERASAVGWTRDPFDRLLVAHARLRGWRLATGDRAIISNLGHRRSSSCDHRRRHARSRARKE